MSEEDNQVTPLSCINPNSSHSSERSSAEDSLGIKRETEPVLQVNLPPIIPPLVDCDQFEVETDAGNTDKVTEGKVLEAKEPLSQDDACQDVEETQGKLRKMNNWRCGLPFLVLRWMLREHCPGILAMAQLDSINSSFGSLIDVASVLSLDPGYQFCFSVFLLVNHSLYACKANIIGCMFLILPGFLQ